MEKGEFEQIRKGNRLAFRELYEKYYSELFAYAMVFVRNEQIAEELVSDVFINLWEKRKKIFITRSLKTYLLQSVKNRSISFLRKKKIDFFNLDAVENYSDNLNPEKKLINQEEKDSVFKMLDVLPPRTREVFVLHRFHGLKYKEIADMLDISPNTVENHIVKAMKILRKNFKSKK